MKMSVYKTHKRKSSVEVEVEVIGPYAVFDRSFEKQISIGASMWFGDVNIRLESYEEIKLIHDKLSTVLKGAY